jgi:TolB-like protein
MRVFARIFVLPALALPALALLVGGVGEGAAVAQAAASGARPERPQVAVIRLTFGGSVAEAARELFAQRLVEGLGVADFQVSAGAPMTARLAAAGIDPAACADDACYRRAGPALDVAYLVTGAVSERQKSYEITLELVNGRTGASIGTHRERCEICGVEEAGEKMGLAASALRARLEAVARAPARFVIRSRPSGALVAVDGQPVGRTPVDREIAGGAHALQISADGYDVSDRSLSVVAGVDETLDVELVPVPSKFPFRTAGWTALAIGVAALAGGIWAEALDGQEIPCADTQRDPYGHCPNVRSTRVLAATLVGLGMASGTLGGVWLYLGQGQGAARPADAKTASIFGFGLSGRF